MNRDELRHVAPLHRVNRTAIAVHRKWSGLLVGTKLGTLATNSERLCEAEEIIYSGLRISRESTRGWNSGIFVRSMLNDHTASKGALMMTSCLDRNGGCKSCLQING